MSAEQLRLARETFEYQQTLEKQKLMLEAQKLDVERQKAWLTGGTIVLPLALGLLTLYWQGQVANRLRDREGKDAFEIKAAEIVFKSDSTVGTKNRARALTDLFPGRFDAKWGDAFDPKQFGGTRYEAKLEVFKAACEKVSTPEEVYAIWQGIFPEDMWIEPLLSKQESLHVPNPGNAA
jgi:hypothetical protein